MKERGSRKRGVSSGPGHKGPKKLGKSRDPFFESEEKSSKRSRKREEDDDEEIESSSDEERDIGSDGAEEKEVEVAEEEVEETAMEKRLRVANQLVDKLRAIEKKKELDDGEDEDSEDEEKERVRREGQRDSRIANILQKEQLEDSGRARRAFASRVQQPGTSDGFRLLVKHRQTVTAVALSEDDSKGFSASKDGTIMHWDVDHGKRERYIWPSDEVLKSHGAKDPNGRATKHSKHILAFAVSSDGRYLASGGLDRHIHLWDVRTRQHIQAFPGHRGPVSCLSFRLGTSELYSGSFDRVVKIWNVEDRAYITTLFGHEGEVLTIDCLRSERALTVGRDRTMRFYQVAEEKQFVFRSSTSLECCSFISNQEFLSGSDDGSIEHWNVLRKKPVHIVKNAHPSLPSYTSELGNGALSNGHIGYSAITPELSSPLARSWVSSLTVCRNSDLAASGAGNGCVRLWAIQNDSKGITPMFELPLVGFVNSLAFARSGKFLLAGVGQEPRLGRWDRIPGAQNGVAVQSLKLS